ncbi:MAG: ribose-phosphate diphosphokinase [Myxococcota bacterium]|nr:ribose-phosphate diphosphokinase [Myxococcota bacterium]
MRPLELHGFDDARHLGPALGQALGVLPRPIEVHVFPDRESRVRVQSDGAERAVLLRSLDDPNRKLVELLFAADALRSRGVEKLVLVAPYLGYMRQDTAFREGEAVSQRVVGRLLGDAFDAVLTVEAHLHRTRRLADVVACDARSLSAAAEIGSWCRLASRFDCLVGPDEESEPWVRAAAAAADLPFLVCRKWRRGDREVVVEVPPARAGARRALLVDDIASSGATLRAAAQGLRERGFDSVEAVVTHALFDAGTERRLRESGIDALLSTDTLPHATNAISTAPLLAAAVTEVLDHPLDHGKEGRCSS